MKIAITGATGFLGSYILRHLAEAGYHCRCWRRESSDLSGFESLAGQIDWLSGSLGDAPAAGELVDGCQALVHAALDYSRSGGSMLDRSFDIEHAEKNIHGTLQLFEAARQSGVERVVFISSCAVYEQILKDRPLDETHPLWPGSHYGAHKAAIEAFVSSYGRGESYSICALRPTGIYGLARPVQQSKWFSLVRDIVQGKSVTCRRGGKEVHASDVAQSVEMLLRATSIGGEAFNCCDRYVSEFEVATLARDLSGSSAEIKGAQTTPKHSIETAKLRGLGVRFGGDALLETTIRQLVDIAARQ